jgi:thiol-disulfide isomerase/thioredoxin
MEKKFSCLCAIFFATAFLTTIVAGAETNSAAQAWQNLTNFSLSSPPASWQTNTPTQAALNKFDDQRAVEAATMADKARRFYTTFPGDENAPRARTTEIQALQLAVKLGLTNREPELIARETTFIANTNAPVEMRYELRLDLLGRQLKAAQESGANMTDELEKSGRDLIKQFPAGPMGYEILLQVAANADVLKTHDLAEAMANSGGPAQLTELGTALLNQLDIVGKASPISFTAADGRKINSSTLSGKVVLVDFWATWNPISIQQMPDLKTLYDKYHAGGLEMVGINFDDKTNEARQFVKTNGIAWPQFYGGFSDNEYGRRFGNALPYVWLVDKKGIVRDIHGRKDTAAKIQKLLAE